jgi:hypothetical protein
MRCRRIQHVEAIEEAGVSIVTGMRMLADCMDPATAHELASELIDEVLRDMLKERSTRH